MTVNKLQMAHEYAMKHIQEGWDINYDVLVMGAWEYADAMQVEAEKRLNPSNSSQSKEKHCDHEFYGWDKISNEPDLQFICCGCGKNPNDDVTTVGTTDVGEWSYTHVFSRLEIKADEH